MPDKLILRNLNSPWTVPTADITKNSVLSWSDGDNNLIYLKGEIIYSAQTNGDTVTLKRVNGNDLSFNLSDNAITGGTLSGTTLILENNEGGGINIELSGLTNDTYIEVTYSELTSFISSSGLTEGVFYLITDYQTIYIQPDYDSGGNPKSISDSMIKTGSTEPIVVLSTSNNTLSKNVWSILHPNDTIEYESTSEELYTGYFTKGKITRRIDKVNNDLYFDFRNVMFKRYSPVGGPASGYTLTWGGNFYEDGVGVTTYGGTGTGLTVDIITDLNDPNDADSNVISVIINNQGDGYSVGDTIYITQLPWVSPWSPGNNATFTITSIIEPTPSNEFSEYRDLGGYPADFTIFGTTTPLSDDTYQTTKYNNKILPQSPNETFNIWAINTVWYNDDFLDNEIGYSCKNNTFGVTFGVTLNAWPFTNNKIGSYMHNNVSSYQMENNIIGGSFKRNILSGNEYLSNNQIGFDFSDNTITASFENNIIGSNFVTNGVGGYFGFNVIGDDCFRNGFTSDFTYNTLENYIWDNTFNYVYSTYISIEFSGNDCPEIESCWIGGYVKNTTNIDLYYTTIEGYMSNNYHTPRVMNEKGLIDSSNIGIDFNSNDIFRLIDCKVGNDFQSNSFIDSEQDSFGYGFNGNSLSESVGNVYGNNVTNNSLSNILNNDIGNNFQNNTIDNIQSFQNNKIEPNIIGNDFSLSTHVFNTYNCTLTIRQDGSQRLKYMDNTDAIIVTNVTD